MIATFIKGMLTKRALRFLPGGWFVLLALSPPGRAVGRRGWKAITTRWDKRQRRRRRRGLLGR